jgi:addiction module HigA family antidote
LKALTTTDLLLVPPGEVLLEEFLQPMGISQDRLAQAIDVPESRINAIVKGRRAITADTDLRLCRFFVLTDGFWLRMQASHDLKQAKQPWRRVAHDSAAGTRDCLTARRHHPGSRCCVPRLSGPALAPVASLCPRDDVPP